MRRWTFTKGHGTGNDFVLLVDREAMIDLSAADVQFICDRHTGIGADGVLRAVLAKHIDGWTGDGSLWFMDYRNADGSIAEMCGNGIRVFVRFLLEESLASGPVVQVATRAGVKEATVLPDGQIRVAMGPVSVGGTATTVTTADGAEFSAVSVDVGNPHAVSFPDDLTAAAALPGPHLGPADNFPDGVNLEFVRDVGERHIAMRVYERGVGETQSCGTGTVAAAAAARSPSRRHDPAAADVPSGRAGRHRERRADRRAGVPDRAGRTGGAR